MVPAPRPAGLGFRPRTRTQLRLGRPGGPAARERRQDVDELGRWSEQLTPGELDELVRQARGRLWATVWQAVDPAARQAGEFLEAGLGDRGIEGRPVGP